MGRIQKAPALDAAGQARASSMATEARRMTATAARRCPRRVEDLECEAARVLVAAAGSYDPDRVGLSWPDYCRMAIYRGLRRKAAALWHREGRMPTRPLGQHDHPARDDRKAREAAAHVAELIDSADVADARLLRMKLDGRGYAEIAAALGLSEDAARRRFYRLARKLRREHDESANHRGPHP
jgi:RNA polymerase sigma factor (sigma-70 family)